MTNWTTLVAKLNKAEKDAQEWADGLKDAERTLSDARAEMAAALGLKAPANGTAHKASAPVLKVVRRRVAPKHIRHDFKRKARVLALLKDKGGFLTVSDVASAEKCSVTLAGGTLRRLASEGKLSRVSRGRYAGSDAKAA